MAGEQALRRSEEYYRSLIDNSSDIVSVLAPDGTIVFQSQGFERLTGGDLRRNIGSDRWEYLHPDDFEQARRALDAAIETGTRRFECRVRRKDGKWLDCEMNGRRIVDLDGRPAAVFNGRDISERKAAERAIIETQTHLSSRLEQQRAVADFGQQALQATEIEPLLDEAVAVVTKTLHVEYGSVMELLPDRTTLRLSAVIGWAQRGAMLNGGASSQSGYTLISNDEDENGEEVLVPALKQHGYPVAARIQIRTGPAALRTPS
ncbi:MAG: PAS domain S-box protein [Candidatus Binataceae bacterium]